MKYNDQLYGPAVIDEPVLLDLLQSPEMQRLRHVLQHGITGFLGLTQPISRFDHSVGVLLLVRRLGASLLEQVAALLHDVSHTAFSHVIDHVLSTPTGESYHEATKGAYLQSSTIPALLARHGYNWRDLLDDSPYTLLEQPAPALCADRLDYFLRDGQALGLVAPSDVIRVLTHLTVHDGRMVLTEAPTARWLAETYIQADNLSWSNPQALGLYELMARTLRLALEVEALNEADLWQTDQQVWDQLRGFPNQELQRQLTVLASIPQFVETSVDPAIALKPKVRTIDPPVLADGTVLPLSAFDADFKAYREAYLQRKQRRMGLQVLQAT